MPDCFMSAHNYFDMLEVEKKMQTDREMFICNAHESAPFCSCGQQKNIIETTSIGESFSHIYICDNPECENYGK